MKKQRRIYAGLVIATTLVQGDLQALPPPIPDMVPLQSGDASRPQLEIIRRPDGFDLRWPSILIFKDKSAIHPLYEIERSYDLVRWESTGILVNSSEEPPMRTVQRPLGIGDQPTYFRVVARWFKPDSKLAASALGVGGDEVFGFGAAFSRELGILGQITPDEFAGLFPAPTNYVTQIDLDPTTAQYWNEFNIPPVPVSFGSIPPPHTRLFDFRLNDLERAVLRKNSFVVSERLATPSFAEMFYRVWMSDLPVFVSSDAMLQAWHRSYDMMLQETENTYLCENLRQILDAMASKVSVASTIVGTNVLHDSVADADYLLAVARSLLAGKEIDGALGQRDRINAALDSIQREALDPCFPLFGMPRGIDFSQFKVRGHYANAPLLGKYFKCVMWLGRTDMRVGGKNIFDSNCTPAHDADPRELGTAVVLTWLLNESGRFDLWKRFDQIVQVFVGWTDSMTFAQMGDLLSAAGVHSLTDLSDMASLKTLQTALESGKYGVQDIRSDYFISSVPGGQPKLPRSFTIFGQKFVPDSWALAKTVFDDVTWTENGRTNLVMRRVPSCLDVAFSVLGNDQIVPDLVRRITDQTGERNLQRDGWMYQHNLAALRRVMDQQPPALWESTIYMDWLATLRTLSHPLTDDPRYPDVFRTHAWAMKSLNTQMASWTQLRHDTILYAKQSYTAIALCSFPDGYVEPVPSFWAHLRGMAERAAKLLGAIPMQGRASIEIQKDNGMGLELSPAIVDLATVQRAQLNFLNYFAGIMRRLEQIAVQELAGQPLSPDDLVFLNSLIEYHPVAYNSNVRNFSGWYPALFYHPSDLTGAMFHQDYGADKPDALIADVHTDLPCEDCLPYDKGSVLQEAVGKVNLLLIGVKRGDVTTLFAGPVLSHFEFEFRGGPIRWTDTEWQAALGVSRSVFFSPAIPESRPEWRSSNFNKLPQLPPWVQSNLVPAF